MSELKSYMKNNYLYFLLWAAMSVILIVLIFPQCSADYINYDSSYQYFLTQHNIGEIFKLLPEDYSPPFYAIALKLFTMIFQPTLFSMRVFSLVAVIGMMFLAIFPVRTAFGKRAGVFCSIMILCSTINLTLLSEIRPTIFAQLFVMATSIYSFIAFYQDKRYAYICMTIFSILSMYTHNIAMLTSLGIYIVVIFLSFVTKKYKSLKNFFISGIICTVAYLPWLFVVLKQFENVKENFWIPAPHSVLDDYRWIAEAPFCDLSLNYILALIYVAISVIICIKVIKLIKWKELNGAKKFSDIVKINIFSENKKLYRQCLFMISELLLSVVIFEVFCAVLYPLSSERYYYIYSGVFLMIFSFFLDKFSQKILTWIIIIMVIINSAVSNFNLCDLIKQGTMQEMVEYINYQANGEEIAFLHTHEYTIGIMSYYFPNAKHYVCDDTFTVLRTYDVFTTDIIDIENISEIWNYTDRCYIFSNENFACLEKSTYELVDSSLSNCYIESIKTYKSPYVYFNEFDLCRIENKTKK